MKSIALSILLGILFFEFLLAISQGSDPTSGLYNFKRFSEKGILYTKRSPEQKADYYSKLLDKRLEEIRQINKKKEYFLLVSASLRYSTTAGNLTNIILTNKLSNKISPTIVQLEAHKKQLNAIIENSNKSQENLNFIQDTVNYIDTYNKQLSEFK